VCVCVCVRVCGLLCIVLLQLRDAISRLRERFEQMRYLLVPGPLAAFVLQCPFLSAPRSGVPVPSDTALWLSVSCGCWTVGRREGRATATDESDMGKVLESMAETHARLQGQLEAEAKVAAEDAAMCVLFDVLLCVRVWRGLGGGGWHT
jgi:hypothetical protein